MAARIFVLCLICSSYWVQSRRLNEYINHYEPFPYIYIHLRENQDMEFNFHTFGRDFNITLRIGSQLVDANTKITARGISNNENVSISQVTRHLVTGCVIDVNESTVHGHVFNGLFNGVVKVPEEMYFIEPARYFISEKVAFETIIYRLSDVNISAITCRPGTDCNKYKFKDVSLGHPLRQRVIRSARLARDNKNITDLDIESNTTTDEVTPESSQQYLKANICPLRIMVDHVFVKNIGPLTYNQIVAQIMVIIHQADVIFRATDWNDDGTADDIGFRVVEFIIWYSQDQTGYKHTDAEYTADTYLGKMPQYKTDDVCLLVMFSGRDFEDILGVAYIRKQGFAGGICSGISNRRRLNVCLITFFPRGKRLSNAAISLVTSHEIGHAFGSDHDPDECAPKDNAYFIMYPIAPKVQSPNSHKFSPCSRRQVNDVFATLGNQCFIEDTTFTPCGNGIVDSATEECDCGEKKNCDSLDECCIPKGEENECTYNRAKGKMCSSRHDVCCEDCKFVPAFDSRICNPYDYCKKPSYCNGVSKDCPPTGDKEEKAECQGGFGVCIRGICESVACRSAGLISCTAFKHEDACLLACYKNGWCRPAEELKITYKDKGRIKLPDGIPCWDGTGYCKNGQCHVSKGNMSVPNPGEFTPHRESNDDNFNFESLIIMTLYIFLASMLAVICMAFSKREDSD